MEEIKTEVETLAPSHWVVVRTSTMGSALGDEVANLEDQVIAEFDTKEEAEARASELNEGVLPEEKELFGTEYKITEIRQKEEK